MSLQILAAPSSPASLETGTPVLQLKHVSKHFRSSRQDTLALSDINLSIREGEFLCIVGPSGCGKSTLLNVVAGFERVDEGEAWSGTKLITGPGPDRVVVFQ